MIGSALSGIGTGAIGFAQLAGAFDPDLPRRNLAHEVHTTLGTTADIFANAGQYQPLYEQLNRAGAYSSLFGGATPAVQWRQRPAESVVVGKGQAGPPGWVRGKKVPGGREWNAARTWDASLDGETPGYAEMLTQLFNQLGPGINEAWRNYAPQITGGLDRLLQATGSDLDAGYNLSPNEMRALQQNLRSAQAARGWGYSPADSGAEALAATQAGQGLRQRRLANYSDALSQYGAAMPNMFNIGSGLFNTALGAQGAAAGRLVDPFNAYSSDLFNTNFNAKSYEELAKIANRKEGAQNVVTGAAAIGDLAMGGGMGGAAGGMQGMGAGGFTMGNWMQGGGAGGAGGGPPQGYYR